MPEQRHTAKLSSVHHWEISYAITRAFGESADDSPPIAAILQLLTEKALAALRQNKLGK